MFERFTQETREVVIKAQQHARRLGHGHIGCEHLLLALAGTGQPAGAVLRGHGITPDRVEEEIVRRAGRGTAAALFGDLDRDALSAIGIDLDAVGARLEAHFGRDALSRAGWVGRGGGHIPFSPGAKDILRNALAAARARHDAQIGVEHIALALIGTGSGLVPRILSALGATASTLRAAILDSYRQAS